MYQYLNIEFENWVWVEYCMSNKSRAKATYLQIFGVNATRSNKIATRGSRFDIIDGSDCVLSF